MLGADALPLDGRVRRPIRVVTEPGPTVASAHSELYPL
jgi:hypothetical protein